MSYLYRVIADAPLGLWSLDIASAGKFVDSSGNANDATILGSPVVDMPIVARGIASQRITGAGFTVPISSVMASGLPIRKFSLETWFKPDNLLGSAVLFQRGSSGIFISGDTITAILSVSGGNPPVNLSYSGLLPGRIYHIVLVYDTKSVYLYLNNLMVAQTDIDPALVTLMFSDAGSTMTFSATSPFAMSLDAVAIYNTALSAQAISDHYALGIDYPDVRTMANFNYTSTYEFCDDNATVKAQMLADDFVSWSQGLLSGKMHVVDDHIENSFDDSIGQYAAGTWQESIVLEPEATVLLGSRLSWEANTDTADLVVSVSVNGSAFVAATNGSQPFTTLDLTTGAEVIVQISAAQSASQTQVFRVNLVMYNTKNVTGTNSDLVASITNPELTTISEYKWEPAAFVGDSGILLPGGDHSTGITIPPDPAFGPYRSLEFTIKIFSVPPTTATIFDTDAPSLATRIVLGTTGQISVNNTTSLIVDGVQKSTGFAFSISLNTWHHIIITFPVQSGPGSLFLGKSANGVNIGPAARIGFIGTYYQLLTTAMATQIYKTWAGATATRIVDNSFVSLSETISADTGIAFNPYAYSWEISSAG